MPPLYTATSIKKAYSLRWGWTGWPSNSIMPTLSPSDWQSLSIAWEGDGIRVLEKACRSDQWQMTVSTTPQLTPSVIVSRLKGRIDHHCRTNAVPMKFSRKVALRAIGNNTIEDVQEYIRKQVEAEQFVDPKFSELMREFTRVWKDDSSDAPLESASGRYWYRLHIVLVVQSRHRIREQRFLGNAFEVLQTIALDQGYRLGALSVMPDHVHVSLRGRIEESPETIALILMNESCHRLKCGDLWQPGYYVGTIGAYHMNAVRSRSFLSG
jgi:REP element-mobilizing transposase RayT